MKQKKGKLELACLVVLLLMGINTYAQSSGNQQSSKPMLGNEVLDFKTQTINLQLVKSSQTVSKLGPVTVPNFDFTPHDRLEKRSAEGFYHLGDLNLRVRKNSEDKWITCSTAANRAPVLAMSPKNADVLAEADLTSILPDSLPLRIVRKWKKEGNQLVLSFEMTNKSDEPVEIGALGIPMIFNNILDGKSLDQAHAENVFYDPYIGMDAGYLQVVRLSGESPVLLIVPEGKTPFEAYRPLLDDPTRRGITFEGFHEWMVHSKAYADKEWKGVKEWNAPTSKQLHPGEKYTVGLRFILTDKVENIEKTLITNKRPVAVGIPGYVLPLDVKAKLFLSYPEQISSMKIEPEGALEVNKLKPTNDKWTAYEVQGKTWGRARLIITYADGLQQSINYKIIEPEKQVVANNGHFLTTKQWFDQTDTLFHRSPSVITYDYEKQQQVTQDPRAWICGLSDEGGAGSWLNAIMKELVEPDPDEIKKLESFVDQTLWGGIQYNQGAHKYGVRKSMFFYEPDSMPPGTYRKDINYHTWAAWDRKGAEDTGRSYNYPHVAAAYWVMYRLARNYMGLVVKQSWQWYLEHAYHTAMAMTKQAPYYAQFGQMEGSVFLLILKDLQREGYAELAQKLEKAMKTRMGHWASLNYPFGSEMPWDSTGQEEVYTWSNYFGYGKKAMITLNAILAYMPTIPHWAYNGNARRYWDFLYGGKLSRIERMIHHYGSGLNAIPVLTQYRQTPDNLYLLRVGYGGLMGTLSNITKDGFAPCAFHSFPSTLKNDGISGDYGSGYYGYAVNSATYITHSDDFGWLAFGGNLSTSSDEITVEPTTGSGGRIYLVPEKLWLTLDAGSFRAITYNTVTKKVNVTLATENEFTPNAFLRLKSYDGEQCVVSGYKKNERGAYVVPLGKTPVTVEIN